MNDENTTYQAKRIVKRHNNIILQFQSLNDAQKSAIRYERAVSQHSAAREMVQLAEEGLLTRGCIFDSTWQEMLNHATTKVCLAQIERKFFF